MDVLNELEALAQVAIQQSEQPDEPHHDEIKRVSESNWDIVRAEKEAEGFNKEAYEYSSNFGAPKPVTIQTTIHNRSFLLRLDGPIANLGVVELASRLTKAPQVFYGTDDDGNPASFCKVDMTARNNILIYLSEHEPRFQPTFVPYCMAAKDLSTTSAYPTLGADATMPQCRPSLADDPSPIPTQSQYPVWYFFYGTLANPVVLGRLLGVESLYKDASIQGGILKMWGGKYKALVDSPGGIVHGAAFLVQDQGKEDILRCYETEKYEVVRCDINAGDEKIRGLTFRFVGDV